MDQSPDFAVLLSLAGRQLRSVLCYSTISPASLKIRPQNRISLSTRQTWSNATAPRTALFCSFGIPINRAFWAALQRPSARPTDRSATVDIVQVEKDEITRDIVVSARDVEHSERIVERIRAIAGVTVGRVADRTFLLHEGGKIQVTCKTPIKTRDDLSMVYTPGVARVCLAVEADPDASFALTIRHNTVAVVSDGSAVLGLGNIGAKAAMPVMEGKCMLFKELAASTPFQSALIRKDVNELVRICVCLAPTFGGINLEDISSPRCVEVEQRLIEALEIPVFHDDQHGTAVVVLAALKNALKIVRKQLADVRIAISGAGAAGAAIAKLLKSMGARQIVICDRKGIIARGRAADGNPVKRWIAENTNPEAMTGSLSDALRAPTCSSASPVPTC